MVGICHFDPVGFHVFVLPFAFQSLEEEPSQNNEKHV